MECIKQFPLLSEWGNTEGNLQKLQGGLGDKVLKNRPDNFLIIYRRQEPIGSY